MMHRAWLIALLGIIVGGATIGGLTRDWIASGIAAVLAYPIIYWIVRKASSVSIRNHEQARS
ncbi:MAG: hypothetical protein ACXVA6_05070 [Isosphaeraceae bacterium]